MKRCHQIFSNETKYCAVYEIPVDKSAVHTIAHKEWGSKGEAKCYIDLTQICHSVIQYDCHVVNAGKHYFKPKLFSSELTHVLCSLKPKRWDCSSSSSCRQMHQAVAADISSAI